MATRLQMEAICIVLKKRFNNLSVEELFKLTYDVVEAYENAEQKK